MTHTCFAWKAPAIWPHALRNPFATPTTNNRDEVTCSSCLWALGSQQTEPPVGHGADR